MVNCGTKKEVKRSSQSSGIICERIKQSDRPKFSLLTLYYYHVTYVFQSESTLNCLNVKELLARNRHNIWSLNYSNESWSLNHLVCERKLTHLANLVKWLSDRLRTKWLRVRIPLLSLKFFSLSLWMPTHIQKISTIVHVSLDILWITKLIYCKFDIGNYFWHTQVFLTTPNGMNWIK